MEMRGAALRLDGRRLHLLIPRDGWKLVPLPGSILKRLMPRSEIRVGLISDTHGLLRPEALAALAGSDIIIHAGDIGTPEIVDALRRLAPTVAVRGNIDSAPWTTALPSTEQVELGAARFFVLHDVAQLKLDPVTAGFAAVVFGHSHKPTIENRAGVLYFNPGSAGPRRFTLPVTIGRAYVSGPHIRPEIVHLPV